ncbi:hypothetical protein [Streptosporangium sp. NPDC002524]|uniref:hypothetical protein n=1 Tax=Streptosporangium sp. NPDC002524 TaxID=3154537 RepID=UPI00332652BF
MAFEEATPHHGQSAYTIHIADPSLPREDWQTDPGGYALQVIPLGSSMDYQWPDAVQQLLTTLATAHPEWTVSGYRSFPSTQVITP